MKEVPRDVVYCRGTKCSSLVPCEAAGECLYKSSADEARAVREKRVEQIDEFPETVKPVVRTFASGANRDVDTSKLDFEGFLSPIVLERFAEYMHKNRFLRDGTMRDSDNWQKGIPRDVYIKSMFRHFFAVWKTHRQGTVSEEDLCALLFNVQGMLHEILKGR